jgi:predicted amino acid-binding ACT domain protein
VLRGLGHDYLEGSLIVVDVMDQPGGLADVTERLAKAGVNILGTLTVGRRAGVMEMAFTVDDEEKARAALTPAELAGVA